jgi:23S rRNA pseudouridine1911/1915/1917 synthase
VIVILHEDPHCLVVVKPPGQFTQGTWAPPGEITLETAVRQYLDPGDPRAVYLGIVHRLDRPTSGLLIWAKTSKAAQRLSTQFQRRRVVKEYWAIVESSRDERGQNAAEETWIDWLTHADANGVVSIAPAHTVAAREAITKVRFEAAGSLDPRFVWLRLWPQTRREECRFWAIPLMDRRFHPRLHEELRFTHAHFLSTTPSPART